MNNRLLILADPYGKPSYAPRLRYLCDYLTRQGWEIEVWTEKWQAIPFEHDYPIHEITIYSGSKIDWALKAGWSLLTDWKNRVFCNKVCEEIAAKRYDAVFCTTFSTFPLYAAQKIARQRNIPFIADIRDLDEQVPGEQYQYHRAWWTKPFKKWYRNVNIRRRNRAVSQADYVTTVSPWHVDFLKNINPNTQLVFNGYDPKQFYPEDRHTDRFLVSYIGKIYEFQDISPLTKAVDTLRKEGKDITLNLHTPDKEPLPINAIGEEIRKSSVMLVLTNPAAHGMMTTKFYEALGCEKPVLCIPSDRGVLAEAIRKTNAGIAANTQEEICRFIGTKYVEWQNNGFTRQQVNPKEKEAFSREKQAQQMEQLILSAIQKTHHYNK